MISTRHVTPTRDKAGRQYELIQDKTGDVVTFWLSRLGITVGEAKCLINSGDMLLGDLLIYDQIHCNFLQRLQRSLSSEPKNYRGLGLGTAILKAVLETAKEEGIACVHGSITQQDLDETPHLLEWYKRHGFQAEEPTEQEVKSAIARICLHFR